MCLKDGANVSWFPSHAPPNTHTLYSGLLVSNNSNKQIGTTSNVQTDSRGHSERAHELMMCLASDQNPTLQRMRHTPTVNRGQPPICGGVGGGVGGGLG